MINSVKARTPIMALILFVFAVGYTFAANKVVVIPMGPDAPTTQWALIKSNGTIAAQSGGITVARVATGAYFVTFGKDVSGHALIATVQNNSNYSDITLSAVICGGPPVDESGELAGCWDAYNNTNNVLVMAWDQPGSTANTSFYLATLP